MDSHRTSWQWKEGWCSIPVQFRGVSLSLLLLNLHFVALIFSWFNWRYFMSTETSLLGDSTPKLHLAFCVIGTFGFFFVGSLYMYGSYRWAAFLREKSRRNRLLTGIAWSYITHVLPLWIIEFGIVWTYGWLSLLQGTHFVFLSMLWFAETILVWLAFIWHAAGVMQERFGDSILGGSS